MSIGFSTQGAHVFHWQPNETNFPVLFCSEKAIFEKGKSIRGGIPVCWPWFGPKEGYMQHGFARTSEWLLESDTESNGERKLRFTLQENEYSRSLWNHSFSLTLNILVKDTLLELELITLNTDNEAFEISQALHTYFFVDDIDAIKIDGLDNVTYIDKVDHQKIKVQEGLVAITEETDRIYLSSNALHLLDENIKRSIYISGDGITSWVIWNPWTEKVKSIPDMSDKEYKKFVCIEAANADRVINILPNESYTLKMIMKLG